MLRFACGTLSFLVFVALILTGKAVADANIAPYSVVRSSPYLGAAIKYLTDLEIGFPERDNSRMLAAPLLIRNGHVMPLELEFRFPSKVPVTGIRLFQHKTAGRRSANGYVVELDTTGDGSYQREVVSERYGKGGQWFKYRLPQPVSAFGLRFRTTEFPTEPGPNYGGPAIAELEIYTAADLPEIPPRRLPQAPPLLEDSARALPIRSVVPDPRPWSEQFQRGTFGSMWLFWSAGQAFHSEKNAPRIEVLKRLQVNRYWLYPGVYVPRNPAPSYVTKPKDPNLAHYADRVLKERSGDQVRIVPFPSSVVLGYRENVLKKFVRMMHENNIGVLANESLLPIGLKSWDFPRVSDFEIYPSVRCSSFVRNASTQLYREYMKAGVDGLVLGGDEFFLRVHPGTADDRASVCRDVAGRENGNCAPSCAELFAEKYGVGQIPAGAEFNSEKAKWTLFQYTQLADLFGGYTQMMKSINPNAIVTSLFRAAEGNRSGYGIAYDIMGSIGRVEELSTDAYWSHDSYLGHYFFANEAKKLIAASLSKTAAITLQATPHFDPNGYADPAMLYGPAFSTLMHGIRGINFYKHDYFFSGGKDDPGPLVEKFFRLVRYLEDRDLLEYEVPKKVALLYSRASDDWWELKNRDDPVLAAEATLYQNATMELLFRNGIPFNLYYLDQPESLTDLDQSSLIILPFPYSMPAEAAGKIQQAMSKGSHVLALQRDGEVDEYGANYDMPLLSGLPGIERRKIPLNGSNYSLFERELTPEILNLLGGDRPLALETDGSDIECSLLSKQSDRLVFCFNWEDHATQVNLGLNLDPGAYGIRAISLDQDRPAAIGGKFELDEHDLRLFRLELKPGQPLVLSVRKLGQ